ncbi:alpha/beta fold hydrolase [Rubeoparvulum massiliense]|uniref:alpha/beta fold hydrolase n=1 Tax=Rubeoparvulum massiliense TaxID=1631346 RepID=UPI00065E0208|nr:alpha/beta fold hydrolase [Rubeoparvulum massiliense]
MPKAQLSDIQLYYEWHPKDHADVIVLVNGLLTNLRTWDPHIERLKEHYSVLCYDCRGQGKSNKPAGPYTSILHAQDLLQLLDHLQLEQVHGVGISNGGAVLQMAAIEAPERFSSLFLADTYPQVDRLFYAKLHSWLQAMEAGGGLLRFDVALPYVWGPRFLEENYDQLLQFREYGANLDSPVATWLIQGALQHDALYGLKKLTMPIRCIVGEHDILTPAYYSERIIHEVSHGDLRIMAGAGHASAYEQPAEFVEELINFLNAVKKGEV